MSSAQEDLLELLRQKDFDSLIGWFEGSWLECKSQPYQLAGDQQKLELAKDVSALANSAGGIILLGFSTTRDPTHGTDIIEGFRPIRFDLVDHDQYQKVIAAWLWPPLENVRFEVFRSPDDQSKGAIAVIVPRADVDRPVLVAKALLDNQRRTGLLFGYCERKGERVTHMEIAEIHTLLRDGLLLQNEIRGGFESLRVQLEAVLEDGARPGVLPDEVQARLETAIGAVDLSDSPSFALVASPNRRVDLRGLFESRAHPLVRLLETPPEVRNAGFDLNAGGDSRISSSLRRTYTAQYKLLEAHRDGVVIFIARGDQDGLCWGRRSQQASHDVINQLALVELIFLFCKLVSEIYSEVGSEKTEVEFRASLHRPEGSQRPILLEPGALDRFSIRGSHPIPLPSLSRSTRVDSDTHDPARWAFELLFEIYTAFGIEADRIPYTDQNDLAERRICTDAIATVR